MTIDGHLVLSQKGDTYFTTYFNGQPAIPNSNTVEGESAELPLGQRLIGKE
jgi:hypothetical protein